jgi:uncharacterized integral membrane protein
MKPDVPAPGSASASNRRRRTSVQRTRMSSTWIALICGAVILLLLLIFILENSQSVDIAYFGFHGHLPLGVALLIAAVCGILLVVIPGIGRIVQLRRSTRRAQQQAVGEPVERPVTPVPPTTPPTPATSGDAVVRPEVPVRGEVPPRDTAPPPRDQSPGV